MTDDEHVTRLYINVDGVSVTREKSPTSEVLSTLARGTPVTVVEERGSRFRIRLPDGATGWISKKKVSPVAPDEAKTSQHALSTLDPSPISPQESRTGGSLRG